MVDFLTFKSNVIFTHVIHYSFITSDFLWLRTLSFLGESRQKHDFIMT